MRMFIAQNKADKVGPFPDTYFNEYGGLYNWWAMDGLANTGWRVPSGADWTTLTDYVNTNYNQSPDDIGVGCHLKSERTQVGDPTVGISTNLHPRWDYHATNYGRDTLDFKALPGQQRTDTGSFFGTNVGAGGYWWTTTIFYIDVTPYYRHYRMLYNLSTVDSEGMASKKRGLSIRLLRDATTNEQDSEHVDFIADGAVQTDEYTGHDGKKYDAIRIGTQVWITENLKETKRKVGEDLVDIAIVTGDAAWAALETAAMCAYPKP